MCAGGNSACGGMQRACEVLAAFDEHGGRLKVFVSVAKDVAALHFARPGGDSPLKRRLHRGSGPCTACEHLRMKPPHTVLRTGCWLADVGNPRTPRFAQVQPRKADKRRASRRADKSTCFCAAMMGNSEVSIAAEFRKCGSARPCVHAPSRHFSVLSSRLSAS